MKGFMLLVVLVLSLSTAAISQQMSDSDEKIVAFIFNAQWEQADSLIEFNMKADPENPRYYYLKLPLHYYTRYYNNGALNGDSLMQLVHDYALKTIEMAESAPESPLNNFYIGSAYDYLSRYNMRYAGNWDAYWSARNAISYLEDAIDEDPSLVDAYMGLAVVEYFTAVQTSGFVRGLAWIVGMLGDRETALSYMHNVAENGKLCKNEAQFALASVYRFFENDYETAHNMLSSMLEQFPRNSFLLNLFHQTRLMQVIAAEGVAVLSQEPADSVAVRFHITNPGILNQLGYALIGENRMDEAIQVFLVNIELYKDSANPYDSIAECYQLMGNYQKSVDYSRIALKKLETDETINDAFRDNLRQILEERLDDLASEVNI
jgi:tetratricopeptide (TPR) repeat protein